MKKKLLVVDGNSILNRAFYGVRPLTTKDGFPTNALFGMVNMIERQVEALVPDRCAVAFDLKAPTLRHKKYEAYKAGRRPMPPELAQQFPVAKELLTAMGFSVLELAGYEADDILGTLARLGCEEDYESYLLTGDRDALQLIGEGVHVLLVTNAETIDMDTARFVEKYGVLPSQFVDVKALMGDSSDNIPGVPGIGEKTALKLISEFGSLDGVFEQLPVAKHTPSVRAKLEGGRESAYLSQDLATIYCEVPLDRTVESLADGQMDRAAAKALFLRLEFSGFIKKFGLDAAVKSEAASEAPMCAEASCECLNNADREESVALFGKGEDWKIAFDGGRAYCRVEREALEGLLEGRRIVCYDCKNLYKQLPFLEEARHTDLMLAAYLANSSKADYALATLTQDYLGETLPEDAIEAVYLLRLQEPILEKLDASGQTSLLCELEMPLAAVLSHMETVGFRIDREGIAAYGDQLGVMAEALEAQIYFHAGKVFNIHSPKQLGEVLFDILKLPNAQKTKTGYSTSADILEKLRAYHPIIQDILDYRQVTKLKSTYTTGLLKVADGEGRVHTTFKQTGTATGRLSSTEPNLQNIPIRTEMGRELRRYFLPKNEDYLILDADYSQIELRILAHISNDANLIEAFRSGEDVHTSTAATVFGVKREEVTPDMRKKAKAVNFGIMYGIGAFSLSDDIHVTRAEAQEYIDQYLAGYPGVDRYLKETIKRAYEDGYVTTLFGRKRYIPELKAPKKMQQKFGERVAMNSPIQGTAADIIKVAMIRVHRRLKEEKLDARLILQVHDELLIEAHKDCADRALALLKEEMESAVSYSVKMEADAHMGKTWYEAK